MANYTKREALRAEIARWAAERRGEIAPKAPARPPRRQRAPDGPVPTLGVLQRQEPHWCWLYCKNLRDRCHHGKAVALAQFVIRWGADTSSDRLRRSARCTVCGHKGAVMMHPSAGAYFPLPNEPPVEGQPNKSPEAG